MKETKEKLLSISGAEPAIVGIDRFAANDVKVDKQPKRWKIRYGRTFL
jgi:hypothetical protein